MISNIIHFLIKQTFCEHLFYGTKNNKLQRQDNHSNIHLIIYSDTRKVFNKMMQHVLHLACFLLWFNMRKSEIYLWDSYPTYFAKFIWWDDMILKSHFCDSSWSKFSSRNAKNISETFDIRRAFLKEIKQGKQRLKG